MISFPDAQSAAPGRQAGHAQGQIPVSPALDLQKYSSDGTTEIVICNGRKSISIVSTPPYAAERSHILPPSVVEHISRQPITSALFTHRLGYVPQAVGRHVQSPLGEWSYMLLICLSGTGHLTADDCGMQMTRGNFVLMKPFQAYSYVADIRDPWSYYYVHFHGQLAPHYGGLIEAAIRRPSVSVGCNVRLVDAFERILGIYADGYSQQNMTCASIATHQLLGEVLCLAQYTRSAQSTVQDRIDRTVDVINRNLSMQVSIPELAAHANMSRSYFVSQFRKRTGTSPRSYINRLRIVKACEQLQAGDDKIESIAQSLGFSDSFYFCRMFKQIVGCTPSEHRHSGVPSHLRLLKTLENQNAGADTGSAVISESANYA